MMCLKETFSHCPVKPKSRIVRDFARAKYRTLSGTKVQILCQEGVLFSKVQ